MALKPIDSTHPGPIKTPATKAQTNLKPQKSALKSRLGLTPTAAFSKRGEWKTIEQREQHQRRDKKIQQVGIKGMGIGVGATALALRAGPAAVGSQLRNIKSGYQFARDVPAARNLKMIRTTAVNNPLGATAVAGGAAIAGGGSIYVGGRSAQAYHQRKINQRRRARFGKAAPMDHEPSGFSRYGNGSGVGRKQVDEFSKGLYKIPSSQVSAGGKQGLKRLKGAGEEAAQSQWQQGMKVTKAASPLLSGKYAAMALKSKNPKVQTRALDGVERTLASQSKGRLVAKADVSKRVRNKDAEADRQRRLGVGIAATGLGAIALGGRGLKNAAKTTQAMRNGRFEARGWKSMKDNDKRLFNRSDESGKQQRGIGLAARPGELGQIAGGGALGATSLGIDHYSRSSRNRRWE